MWTTRLSDKLVRDGIILPENAEIVQYGLEALTGNLAGALITLATGYCFGSILSGLILWMLFFPLRKYAGGYHAKTRGRCYLISIGMLVLAYVLLYLPGWKAEIYFAVTIISGGYIFTNAPVDNENRVLDMVEQSVYRKRTRIVLGLEGILFAAAWILRWENLMAIVAMCFAIVGISLAAGKIKR